MRKKSLTIECSGCNQCIMNDSNQATCTWGNGESKVMFPPKGKKTIHCKLKRD